MSRNTAASHLLGFAAVATLLHLAMGAFGVLVAALSLGAVL